MRTTVQDQPPLLGGFVVHSHGEELAEMDRLLREKPGLLELVNEDLQRGCQNPGTGRRGMSAEQVLRVLIVKQMTQCSYRKLAFHLADSQSYRSFCQLGFFDASPTRSTLQSNMKRIRAETLDQINHGLLGVAKAARVEAGRRVRVDATVVGTNIHVPTDSSLLYDVVRVLSRLMKRGQKLFGVQGEWHTRRAKRRALEVLNSKDLLTRRKAYQDLLMTTRRTMRAAQAAADGLNQVKPSGLLGEDIAKALASDLGQYIDLGETVVHQAEQRVMKGNTVPQDEKLFSIFEPHTDIIIKDRRAVQFGHKVTLTTGKSSLILDCVIEEGNPADTTLATRMIQRQSELYERPPRQASLDGGYASKVNVAAIKGMGVKDVAMHKKRGIDISEMASSAGVFKVLRNFRAGIEGGISFLKRCFGLDRCLWEGYASFKAYVWASVLAANLLMLARHRIAS